MSGNSSPAATGNAQAIRWWEILLVPLGGMVWWLGFLALVGFSAGVLAPKLGYSTDDVRKFVTPAHLRDYFFIQLLLVTLYLAFLVNLGFALRGRRSSLVATYSRDVSALQIGSAAILGVLLAAAVMFGIDYLSSKQIVQFHELPGERLVTPHTFDQFFLLLPAFALLAPFVEELYFRGFVLTWLGQKLPAFLAALVSAIIFSLVHGQFLLRPGNEGLVVSGFILLVGLINAIWAQRSRSLWPALAVHAAYNGTLVLSSYLF